MNGNVLTRRRFAKSVARFIVLGVLVPNLAYMGHWGYEAGEAAHEQAPAQAPGSDEHDLHCHSGPATCTGGAATIGSINVNDDSGLITPEGTVIPTLDAPAATLPDAPYARLLHPPQVA